MIRIPAIAAALAAALAFAPAAPAQAPDPVKTVETIVGSLEGGVQQHKYACKERPETLAMINGVKRSLSSAYPDITTMLARGYFPYADAFAFGFSGRQGHWINPNFIEDVYPAGHPKAGKPIIMDPDFPESILVDRWNRPIGVMFITDDPEMPGPDMYVDEETGVPCNAWHYHTETLADAYWYAYKYLFSGDTFEGDVALPNRTPDLMHVWRYGEFKHQWTHAAPPQEYLPGDPGSYQDVKTIVGGPRIPIVDQIPPGK